MTVALSFIGSYGVRLILDWSKDTQVVCTIYVVTFIICVNQLLAVCPVTVHSHTDIGVIVQSELTVATELFEVSRIIV